LKLDHILTKNADVSKKSADFTKKCCIFRKCISRATSMPKFRSL